MKYENETHKRAALALRKAQVTAYKLYADMHPYGSPLITKAQGQIIDLIHTLEAAVKEAAKDRRLTLPRVNEALAKLGKIELVKCKRDYFYFAGEDVIGSTGVKGDTFSVYTPQLNTYDLDGWISNAKYALRPLAEGEWEK